MGHREMTEEELQEMKVAVECGQWIDVRKLFDEIEWLKKSNKQWRDHVWDCMQKIIRLEKYLDQIASGDHDVWECERIANEALNR